MAVIVLGESEERPRTERYVSDPPGNSSGCGGVGSSSTWDVGGYGGGGHNLA